MVFLIACVDSKNGIGKEGKIPWMLKPDIARFCEMTTNSVIIMGRGTWESIGSKPLVNRTNIVVSSSRDINNGIVCSTLEDALDIAIRLLKPIYIIGGERLYKMAMPHASKVYLTRINESYDCDRFFPMEVVAYKKAHFGEWKRYNDIIYRYETYDV